MQIVPGVMDYLDKKKRESYYEEVKTFKTNLDVVRECRCENSLMTLDVAKARVAAARGPADQADAHRRLKLIDEIGVPLQQGDLNVEYEHGLRDDLISQFAPQSKLHANLQSR
jgi:hypothetical protein